eukprot:gene12608-biopygen15514
MTALIDDTYFFYKSIFLGALRAPICLDSLLHLFVSKVDDTSQSCVVSADCIAPQVYIKIRKMLCFRDGDAVLYMFCRQRGAVRHSAATHGVVLRGVAAAVVAVAETASVAVVVLRG